MELRHLLAVVWKRRLAVLAVLVLTLALAGIFALLKPKEYESTAVIALTPDTERGSGLLSSDNLATLLGTYSQTVKSSTVRAQAAESLGHPLDADISTSTKAGTGILRITARGGDADQAAAGANAVATTFVQSISSSRFVDAEILEVAQPSDSPVEPRPPLILGVAVVLGLFGGVLLAVGLESFRRRVETVDDVADLTPAPVLGRIPRGRALSRAGPGTIWAPGGSAELQEAYRTLRTNLGFLLGERGRVVELTAAEGGQGCSAVVANLAMAFAQVGVETVVIDADLHRPAQHTIFGLDNSEGLTTAMAHGGEPRLQEAGHPNLRVLTSGPTVPDPTEMLHIRFPSVLDAVRSPDALILIDTPPVIPVSDARLIAPRADHVVLVVAAGTLRPSDLGAALERLRLVEARLLGLVLNRDGDGVRTETGYRDRPRGPGSAAPAPADPPRIGSG